MLLTKREYQAAQPFLETALEINPNDFFAAWMLSLTHIRLNQLDEAEASLRQLVVITGIDAWSIGAWAELYIVSGDETSARDMLAQVIALHDAGSEEPALVPMIAMIYGYLGEAEEAVNWFERGTETPNPVNNIILTIKFHDRPAIWNHPRFQALLIKTNLDDDSVATAKAAAASQY